MSDLRWGITPMYPTGSTGADPQLFHFKYEPEFGRALVVDVPNHPAVASNIFEAWNIAKERFKSLPWSVWISE